MSSYNSYQNQVTSHTFKTTIVYDTDNIETQNQTQASMPHHEQDNETSHTFNKKSDANNTSERYNQNIQDVDTNKGNSDMHGAPEHQNQQEDDIELFNKNIKEEIVVNLDPLSHYSEDDPLEEPFSLSCTFCKQSFPTVTELMTHRITHVTDFYHQDGANLPSPAGDSYHSVFGIYGLLNNETSEQNLHGSENSVTSANSANQVQSEENAKTALNIQKQLAELEKPYACPICGKRLSNKSSFSRHKSAHSNKTTFTCELCEKTFTRKGHLETHKKLHTGIKPFECEICLKIFSQQNYLNDHMRRHSDEKNYSCTICWKRFKSNSAFRTHEAVVHATERKFKCTFEDCGKSFTRKAQWQLHERIHQGIKPFQCNVCQRQFARNCALQEHLLTHSDVKPFFCQQCNKQYARKAQLQLHLRTHSKVKPFACVECGKQYTLMSSLKYHMKIHESAEVHKERNEMRRLSRKSRSYKYKNMNLVYVCDLCGESYCKKNQISIHLKRFHPKLWVKSEPTDSVVG